MKKLSAVLLVTVLVCASVFASFTGNFKTTFTAGLGKDKAIGFANAGSVSFDVDLIEPIAAGAKGEGSIYAEINASGVVKATNNSDDYSPVNNLFVEFKIKKAQITNGDWFVGIMGANTAFNYVKSALDVDSDGNATNLRPQDLVTKPAGINAGVAGFTVSFGLANSGEIAGGFAKNLYATVTTPDFAVMEGLTIGAGAMFSRDQSKVVAVATTESDKIAFGFGGKVAYASDALNASAAADFVMDKDAKGSDKYAKSLEAAINVAYAPVTVDGYFLKDPNAKAKNPGNKWVWKPAVGLISYAHVKAAVALDAVKPYVGAALNFNEKALIPGGEASQNAYKLYAGAALPVGALTVDASGYYVLCKIEKSNGFGASASVKYTADFGFVKAGADLAFVQNSSDEYKLASIEPYVTAESTTVVPGATLTAKWAKADFVKVAEEVKSLGEVSLACKIAF